MATTKSFGQLDLGPRRVGIHLRKPACRSVACGEVLGWGPAGTSTPAHDRQALLMRVAVLPVADALRHLSEAFRGARADDQPVARRNSSQRVHNEHQGQRPCEAVQQSDAADEGRLEAGCSILLGRHRVVRLSS
jgi:hypothetical protein